MPSYSPAQLLMRHSLQAFLPTPVAKRAPDWLQVADFKDRDRVQRQCQVRDFNRHHSVHNLSSFNEGEEVWVHDARTWATVLSQAQRQRSYVVQMPTGVLVRNRQRLTSCTSQQTPPKPSSVSGCSTSLAVQSSPNCDDKLLSDRITGMPPGPNKRMANPLWTSRQDASPTRIMKGCVLFVFLTWKRGGSKG